MTALSAPEGTVPIWPDRWNVSSPAAGSEPCPGTSGWYFLFGRAKGDSLEQLSHLLLTTPGPPSALLEGTWSQPSVIRLEFRLT